MSTENKTIDFTSKSILKRFLDKRMSYDDAVKCLTERNIPIDKWFMILYEPSTLGEALYYAKLISEWNENGLEVIFSALGLNFEDKVRMYLIGISLNHLRKLWFRFSSYGSKNFDEEEFLNEYEKEVTEVMNLSTKDAAQILVKSITSPYNYSKWEGKMKEVEHEIIIRMNDRYCCTSFSDYWNYLASIADTMERMRIELNDCIKCEPAYLTDLHRLHQDFIGEGMVEDDSLI